jgi:hypothetical protein
VAIDGQGVKWLATSGGVVSFDGTAFTTYTTADGLAHDAVSSVALDQNGIKWFGTSGGLSRFDGTAWTTFPLDGGLESNAVNFIAVDAQGVKWITTSGQGVSSFTGGAIIAKDKPAPPALLLSFYPNPSRDFIWFNWKSTDATVTLFDLSGKLLLQQPLSVLGAPLDIRHLPKGLYLLQVHDKEGALTGRLLKE